MAQRLNTNRRPSGSSRNTIRLWGLLCLTLGTLGFSILQNGVLNLGSTDTQTLLAAMQADEKIMGAATAALVLQAIHCCAAPLFAFLLVEGFSHTRSLRRYFLRVLGVAVLSELPFNLAVSAKWIDAGSRNPVLGLVLAMLMLYFFRRYTQRSFVNYVIKAVVFAAAILWSLMLGVHDGAPLVLLTAVLWALRNKAALRMIIGCIAAFACSLFSPFYMAAPISFIALHFYNGEKGDSNPWVDYLSYPAILLALGLLGKYLI